MLFLSISSLLWVPGQRPTNHRIFITHTAHTKQLCPLHHGKGSIWCQNAYLPHHVLWWTKIKEPVPLLSGRAAWERWWAWEQTIKRSHKNHSRDRSSAPTVSRKSSGRRSWSWVLKDTQTPPRQIRTPSLTQPLLCVDCEHISLLLYRKLLLFPFSRWGNRHINKMKWLATVTLLRRLVEQIRDQSPGLSAAGVSKRKRHIFRPWGPNSYGRMETMGLKGHGWNAGSAL